MAAEFRILGPLEVLRDGRPVPLRAAKQRALLADLLIERGRVVSVDRLIDDLWQEAPPARARHALEAHASRLRGVLGADASLVAQPPGYLLAVDPGSLDAWRFEQLLAGARAESVSDPARAAAHAVDALALWRGPALADFRYAPFAQAEIARLEELRWEAVHVRVDAELALGSVDLVPELESLVAAEPLRERLRAQLMLVLYRSGRQADALAAFRDARATLVEELGVEPGPELRELEAAILRHDDALARRPPVAPAPHRKLATVLAADADAGRLELAADPEALHELHRSFRGLVTEAVGRHGGTLVGFSGDAVTAVFGIPFAHEDDALRAGRAAADVRGAVGELGAETEGRLGAGFAVRVALATGEVVANEADDPPATGRALAIARALCHETRAGEIAVDELTRRLLAPAARCDELQPVALPGGERPLRTFRLTELRPGAPALARNPDSPLVGREHELARLRAALADAVARSSPRTVSVLGPPGIGKSRLVAELAADAAAEATIISGHCSAYGDPTALAPLGGVLGSVAAVGAALAGAPDEEAVVTRLAAVLAGEPAVPAEEVPWAVRRYCEALASRRPVVLVLDDLHWAAPELLDVVEHLAASLRDVPLLLVCAARDELDELRPTFLSAGERLVLEPLTAEATAELADHLVPDYALDDATRSRLVAAAEGNPLFLEQLAAQVAQSGSVEPPPTLRALLAARLDRLGPGERDVLERAAVAGLEFAPAEVAELLDPEAAGTVSAHLAALTRRGYLVPADAGRVRFCHWLMHDTAYRAAPKALRAELHERCAGLLERHAAGDELVGGHLERSYRLRVELAAPDVHALRLAQAAGRRLAHAGLRAWKRSETAGACDLLGRAVGLLPDGDDEQRELLCELGIALNSAGEPEHGAEILSEAAERAAQVDDRRVELRARIELAAAHLLDEPEAPAKELFDLAERALPLFESLGDHRALGRTWMLTGWVHGGLYCQNATWKVAAERALQHYRNAGFPTATCVGHVAAALYFGPTPAAEGIARCHLLLEDDVADLSGEANVLSHLAGLEAMLGDFDKSYDLLARASAIYADLGQPTAIIRTCSQIEAAVARLAGDPERAVRALTASCVQLEKMGNWFHLSTQAAELADALWALGRTDDARTWTSTAEKYALRDDAGAQLSWRAVSARLLAGAGDVEAAERLAREAAAIAEATDARNQQASVHLALADVLAAVGRNDESEAATAEALRLFEEKGNAVAVARLRAEHFAAASS